MKGCSDNSDPLDDDNGPEIIKSAKLKTIKIEM